jgi:preprotein translocase subunit Sec61beta
LPDIVQDPKIVLSVGIALIGTLLLHHLILIVPVLYPQF